MQHKKLSVLMKNKTPLSAMKWVVVARTLLNHNKLPVTKANDVAFQFQAKPAMLLLSNLAKTSSLLLSIVCFFGNTLFPSTYVYIPNTQKHPSALALFVSLKT